jgi:hypothetical protein
LPCIWWPDRGALRGAKQVPPAPTLLTVVHNDHCGGLCVVALSLGCRHVGLQASPRDPPRPTRFQTPPAYVDVSKGAFWRGLARAGSPRIDGWDVGSSGWQAGPVGSTCTTTLPRPPRWPPLRRLGRPKGAKTAIRCLSMLMHHPQRAPCDSPACVWLVVWR